MGEDRSAGRWCDHCQQHGSHHTDRHDEFVILAVGCPYCGASSGEACWSDVRASKRDPHATRRVFARRLSPERVLITEPHDGHPETETCPGCPHRKDDGVTS